MLILVVVFYHSYRKITTTEIDTRIVGHCCDRHDHVLGRIVEGLWNFRLGKSLSVQSLLNCCGIKR